MNLTKSTIMYTVEWRASCVHLDSERLFSAY
jgi:hypothetical protein